MSMISKIYIKQVILNKGKKFIPVLKAGGYTLASRCTGMTPYDAKIAATTLKDTGSIAKACYGAQIMKGFLAGVKAWGLSRATVDSGLTPHDIRLKGQTIYYVMEGMKIHTNNFFNGLRFKKAPSK